MDPAYLGLGINPLWVKDGILTIHAAKSSPKVEAATGYDYTSGMISSKSEFAQTYGYFEIKCELPAGKGTWPAFWLLPQNGSWPPELDVFEVLGNDTHKVYTTVHSNANGVKSGYGSVATVDDLSDGMHTFGVLWTKSELVWYVDGEEVFRAPTPGDMHKPMYMVANLAIGGYWPGNPDANFTSADMKIDYIKAYSLEQLANNPAPTPVADADIFYVNASSPKVIDSVSGDGDLVNASISYTLTEHVENLTLTGTGNLNGAGNAEDNIITGNSGNNVLSGLAGDDVLDGRGGSDLMIGGTGDDTYHVSSTADRVMEQAGQGNDTVHSTVDHTLSSNVENLVLDGAACRGGGNSMDNTITGNAASNYLFGGDGADTLNGNGGDDFLVGGSDVDTLAGGAGNDIYSVDMSSDRVIEAGGAGYDSVNSSASYVLPVNVERLALMGGAALNGTGNASDNAIVGNAGNNVLQGLAGKDVLASNGGKDIMWGGAGTDTFVFNAPGTLRIGDFGAGGEDERVVIGQGSKYAANSTVYDDATGAAHIRFADGSEVVLQGVKADDLHQTGNVFHL